MSEWNPTRGRSGTKPVLGLVAVASLARAFSWLFGRGRGSGAPPEGEPPPVTGAPPRRLGQLPEEEAVALAGRAVRETREEMGRGREAGRHEPQPSPELVREGREERRRREAEEARG